MNAKLSTNANIHEQRSCLNQLDDEIEKAIKELDSLNNNTMNQIKKLQNKASNTKFPSANLTSSLNTRTTTNEYTNINTLNTHENESAKKASYQGYLQLSPENLVDDQEYLKELEYSPMDDESEYYEKENLVPKKDMSPKSYTFKSVVFMNEKTKRSDSLVEKNNNLPLRGKSPVSPLSKKNAKAAPFNLGNNRKSVPCMREYKPEKPAENSKQNYFLGPQQNLRRQSVNSQKPNSNEKAKSQVIHRSQETEPEIKAKATIKNIGNQKAMLHAKPPKAKTNYSYMGSKSEKERLNEKQGPSAKYLMTESALDENPNLRTASTSYTLHNKSLLQSGESQQIFGLQSEESCLSAGLMHKESYGDLAVKSNISDGFFKDESQSRLVPTNPFQSFTQSSSDKDISNGSFSKKEYMKVGSATPNQYQNVKPRYLDGVSDNSKSPRVKAVPDDYKPVFRPQLSKKSLEIAAKLGNSFQRLVESNKNPENQRKLLKEMQSELTFKPKINKTSEQLDEKFRSNLFNGDDLHRWDQLYLMNEKYNIDKEMKKFEKEQQEKQNNECTFHPQLNSNSSRVFRDTTVNFAERALAWKEIKDKKLGKVREALEEKETEGCTFQPSIAKGQSQLTTSRSAVSLNDISQTSIRGLEQHLEKIDKANRIKKEAEARQEKFSGKGWKRQITVPKEFQLHKRGQSAKDYSRQHSVSNLDMSTEEKINKNVLLFENRRDLSPQLLRTRVIESGSYNQIASNNNYENSVIGGNFEDVIVKLHYELQRMEI